VAKVKNHRPLADTEDIPTQYKAKNTKVQVKTTLKKGALLAMMHK
jgi:hypothetical protein